MKSPALRRLRPSMITIVVMMLVLLAAEGGMRLAEPRVGTPARWGTSQIDSKVAQMRALADDGGVDVVFLGSSIVNVGVDPAVFLTHSAAGLTAYNASMNAASPRVLEAWLTELVFPLLDPSVVVIGLSSRELNDNGFNQQGTFHRYIDSPGRRDYVGVQSAVDHLDTKLTEASALFRLRSVLRSPYRFLVRLRTPPDSDISELGHDTDVLDRSYQVTDEFRERITMRVLTDYAINGRELAALERIVAGAQARGAQVYLIDMPVVEADYVPMHPDGWEDIAEYEASFARLTSSAGVGGASARSDEWDSDLFADPLHLNAAGSERLSRWIAEFIRSQ